MIDLFLFYNWHRTGHWHLNSFMAFLHATCICTILIHLSPCIWIVEYTVTCDIGFTVKYTSDLCIMSNLNSWSGLISQWAVRRYRRSAHSTSPVLNGL